MKIECCNKIFSNRKSYTNHRRWCSGLLQPKSETYHALHRYVRVRKNKPKMCEKCQTKKARDLANISGVYTRNVDDYSYLCRSCHKKLDIGEATKIKYSRNALLRQRDGGGRFI